MRSGCADQRTRGLGVQPELELELEFEFDEEFELLLLDEFELELLDELELELEDEFELEFDEEFELLFEFELLDELLFELELELLFDQPRGRLVRSPCSSRTVRKSVRSVAALAVGAAPGRPIAHFVAAGLASALAPVAGSPADTAVAAAIAILRRDVFMVGSS